MLTFVGLGNGVANIIMQLALPPVGHGVNESRVESGSPRRHPIKRARTTGQYLVVAALGDDRDRDRLRAEIARVHADVHSTENSPVNYSGNARELQKWVAACLFQFYTDQYQLLYGPLNEHALDTLTRNAAPLATGVNVPASAWPQTWREMQEYRREMQPKLSIAPEVRADFESLADLTFLGEAQGFPGYAVARILGPLFHFVTRATLPPAYRGLMGWDWTESDQRWWNRILTLLRLGDIVNPYFMRSLYRLSLLDLRVRNRLTGSGLGKLKVLDEPLAAQSRDPRARRVERRAKK